MKSRFLSWGGASDEKYIILMGKPEDDRFLERSGYRYENNIKADLK
jgi:hypothetical protein